jgi:hypothetical protein
MLSSPLLAILPAFCFFWRGRKAGGGGVFETFKLARVLDAAVTVTWAIYLFSQQCKKDKMLGISNSKNTAGIYTQRWSENLKGKE